MLWPPLEAPGSRLRVRHSVQHALIWLLRTRTVFHASHIAKNKLPCCPPPARLLYSDYTSFDQIFDPVALALDPPREGGSRTDG